MPQDTITINDDDDGQRLDRWLKKQRPDLPYVLVQKLLRKGQVRVDGKRAKPDARLAAGQQVRMPMGGGPGDAPEKPHPREGGKDSAWLRTFLLYEDDDVLVFNKPAGLAVQGGSGLKLHLEMLLDDFAKRGVAPRLVHRLDRDTSGVLVLARSARAARRLGEQFADRGIEKTYWALVAPSPQHETGTIDAPLVKITAGRGIEKMQVQEDDGQESQTDYRVLARVENAAWVEFCPRTGRTHQIRVHAAHIGCPLIGDSKYGGGVEVFDRIKARPMIQLHARRMVFTHPRSGEPMMFTAPLPKAAADVYHAMGFTVGQDDEHAC